MPLVRLVEFLFLSTPLEKIEDLLHELHDPIETGGVSYDNPAEDLKPYLPALREFEKLKTTDELSYIIYDETWEPIDRMTAIDSRVGQLVVGQELEEINSLLCGPCHCSLCCIGPTNPLEQHFFEIPLSAEEIDRFALPRIDTEGTRSATASDDSSLIIEGRPFYEHPMALYHWRTSWSLILPRHSRCPNLDETGGCGIYPKRPDICRRPQIFSYVLENLTGANENEYVKQDKILAVWDCPYVRQLKNEIAAYAELSELEPIFKTNKA